jgi:integrase/recombinase XerD
MAKLYRRGKMWYGTLYTSRKRLRPKLSKDKKEADIMLNDIVCRLSRNEHILGHKIPISQYQKDFLEFVRTRKAPKTGHNYSIALNHFVGYATEWHGVRYLQDIDLAMVDGYVTSRLNDPSPARKGSPVARTTVNTELKYIKRFFSRAVELGLLRDSPARRVELLKTLKKSPRFFDEIEMPRILDNCDVIWARDIYLGLLFTGMRIGELVNLEWDDVDFQNRRIAIRAKSFWKPKGNEERSIPLHGAFYELLRCKERKSNWVFTKADGTKVNIHSLEARFKNQLKRLGIQNATLHTWRHTFASHLAMLTGNLRAVQVLLGHKSGRTTEIYSHLADRYLQAVVNQLPSPNLGTNLVTTVVLPGRGIVQVVDKKMVGDRGLEPLTSTV